MIETVNIAAVVSTIVTGSCSSVTIYLMYRTIAAKNSLIAEAKEEIARKESYIRYLKKPKTEQASK